MKLSFLQCRNRAWLLCLALGLGGCAAVRHTPAPFTPVADTAVIAPRTLAQGMQLTLDTGYARTLKAGSAWRRSGSIAQGEVYRPVNDVFTLEGAHIHEAYLVIRDDTLVGFYLPAEAGFSPLRTPLPLRFTPDH